jgi:hypothetical protein
LCAVDPLEHQPRTEPAHNVEIHIGLHAVARIYANRARQDHGGAALRDDEQRRVIARLVREQRDVPVAGRWRARSRR